MKLVKLLSVGRCFRGGADDSSRYKMLPGQRLPQFSKRVAGRRSLVEKLIGWITGGWWKKPAAAVRADVSTSASGPVFATSEVSASSGRPGPGEPGPIQAELALGSVRVIRNDLSDSDLEVVPAGKSPFRPRTAALPQQQREARVALKREKGWDRLSARLFVAGRDEF